eukprot:2813992-Heterocapsa_arctica.AAC.1
MLWSPGLPSVAPGCLSLSRLAIAATVRFCGSLACVFPSPSSTMAAPSGLPSPDEPLPHTGGVPWRIWPGNT